MQVFAIAKYIILKGTKVAEPKFREPLSKILLEKYGKSEYSSTTITEILYYCKHYFITEFESILNNENSYTFYKEIILLHEQAINLRRSEHFNNLPKGIDKSYIAEYRRILKMIIEHGCLIDMHNGEKRDLHFLQRVHPILNELLFLGRMLICICESIAEQEMVEDVSDITFDNDDLYVLGRRHHYEFVFRYIANKIEKEKPVYIIDNNGLGDFKKAILESFDIDYDKIWQALILIMEHFKMEFGECVSADRDGLLKDIENYTETNVVNIEKFLSGMTLSKDNKMNLSDLLKRPHSTNKYLYRPFLIWTINQKKYYVFGMASLHEAQESLYLNAIPWGKVPVEWLDNPSFVKYKNKKHDDHDKWLDDEIENRIKTTGLLHQRSVSKLVTKSKTYSLETDNLGEIDFLIISPSINKIFIADCKHLLGRYDMVNQRNDYSHFTEDGKHKSYNSRMDLKIKWLTENKHILEEHLRLKFQEPTLSLDGFIIEGVFFVNTPTFYMYNSDFRIYTYDQIIDLIMGKFIDPVFSLNIDEEGKNITYSIKYPYFRKPKMIYYQDEDDVYEVDKYGFPIKKSPNVN